MMVDLRETQASRSGKPTSRLYRGPCASCLRTFTALAWLLVTSTACSEGAVQTAGGPEAPHTDVGMDAPFWEEDVGSRQEDSGTGGDTDSLDLAADLDVGTEQCVPDTCIGLGHACGEWNDSCGAAIVCGTCDTAGETCRDGACVSATVDCSGIEANPSFELCESGDDFCAGVFMGGEGCTAFCAAAGLMCSERTGGEPGCMQESQNVLACGENNGHLSDWCTCRGSTPPNSSCESSASNPPVRMEKHYSQATFQNRSAWVLDCRDYAYTAQFEEHEACDSQYTAGSGRGSVTFAFTVPRGEYDVFVEGRHTTNRNPAGAVVTVTSEASTYTTQIQQRDDQGIVEDLHGRYCLAGSVQVVMDSTVSSESDSVRRIVLVPVP
jgi:hypothetical protein